MRAVYIAAPFFNPHQLEMVKLIEEALAAAEIEAISPRKLGKLSPRATAAKQQEVLDGNTLGIARCDAVLAVVQCLNSDGTGLALVDAENEILRGIELPDTGTAWEMGYAAGLGVPTYAFFPDGNPGQQSVMLLRSCEGVIRGQREFLAWTRNAFIPPAWDGEVR